MDEEWRYVPNFPEYVVSNFGEIKKTGRRDAQPLAKYYDNKRGYVYVSLHLPDDGSWEARKLRLDRIVAIAFLDTRWRELLSNDVEHIDGDPKNCAVGNLRWVER